MFVETIQTKEWEQNRLVKTSMQQKEVCEQNDDNQK